MPSARVNARKKARPNQRKKTSPVARYRGAFGVVEAERLLWRAGFGPRPGEAESLAKLGLKKAVYTLTRPQVQKRLIGPAPRDEDGRALAPQDAWGHDHLWWLDRMVRCNHPFQERMTLIWHDWFATNNGSVGSQKLMLKQNALLRKYATGRFDRLLTEVTRNPAMLLFLSGTSNNQWSPNENYARELMELFTLGAKRGYTERDVREQARALTGFRNEWEEGIGATKFRYDNDYHDPKPKIIFGKRGRFDWKDALGLCIRHPKHPSFFVDKMWSYFIPTPPSAASRRSLQQLYVRSGYKILPVVEAILMHPQFYRGPRMVKSPVVYTAGLLRAREQGITSEDFSWLANVSGQKLFYPPNVAGWDEERWLNTGTFRGRWMTSNHIIGDDELDPKNTDWDMNETPEEAVQKAIGYWGAPQISPQTQAILLNFARDCEGLANQPWKRKSYPVLRQNALRMLFANSPDMQTC